ncbi:hypothetical protein M140OLGA_2010 [Staphylococcus aureus subsp. aureus 112808A]|nr:hypothetical protein M140OLGA_2010 [Staphylococcus aureus subsp. aureus 112808A]
MTILAGFIVGSVSTILVYCTNQKMNLE